MASGPVGPETEGHQTPSSKRMVKADRRGARRQEAGPSRVTQGQESYKRGKGPTSSSTYPEPYNHQSPERRLLSVQEAARFLAVSPWMIRSMVWRGTLPSVKIGNGKRKRVLLDRLDLDRYIDRVKHRETS